MSTHTAALVEEYKQAQVRGVTKHLTPDHHPKLVAELNNMAEQLRTMPNQLFVQFIVTIRLILQTIQTSSLYYVQRIPAELGRFKWVIDRKDRTLTQMERLWTTLIMPYGQSYFARRPLVTLEGADYTHFRRFDSDPSDSSVSSQLRLLNEHFGASPSEETGDIKMLLSEERDFADSRGNLGLQLVDIVTSTLRRALNGRLEPSGWENLGRLLVRKPDQESFIQLMTPGTPSPGNLTGKAAAAWRRLELHSKEMLLQESRSR